MIPRPHIYAAIDQERAYQCAKRPTSHAHGHELPGWMAIMRRELDEAERAWIEGDGAPANDQSLAELIQVVATGVAALEQHGVPHAYLEGRWA
jgi:hypothetical protein